jgi:Acetylaranotin biosynthesis cluster protein L
MSPPSRHAPSWSASTADWYATSSTAARSAKVVTFYPKRLVHFVRTHGAARGTIDNEISVADDGSTALTFRFRICLDGVEEGSAEEKAFGEKMTEEYLDAVRTTLAAVRARIATPSTTT